MTRDCVQFAPLIGSRPGELSPEEARALAAHLGGCETCRALAADFAALDGVVADGLADEAARRDFAPFVDQVMARVEGRRKKGLWSWLGHHRRAAAGVLVPVLAALAVLVYVRVDSGSPEIAYLELSSEGEATTVLQTADGPVVLLAEDSGS